MKKIIMLIIVVLSLYGENKTYSNDIEVVKFDSRIIKAVMNQLDNMSNYQWRELKIVVEHSKQDDLAYTCMAISIRESHAGDIMINNLTGDYGLMGINAKWFFYKHNIKGYYNKIRVISKLVRDDEYNVNASVSNLKGWMKRYEGKTYFWYRVWGSYNGGGVPNYMYAKYILNYIIAIKRYLKKHPEKRKYLFGE